jgi:hypothetical protein
MMRHQHTEGEDDEDEEDAPEEGGSHIQRLLRKFGGAATAPPPPPQKKQKKLPPWGQLQAESQSVAATALTAPKAKKSVRRALLYPKVKKPFFASGELEERASPPADPMSSGRASKRLRCNDDERPPSPSRKLQEEFVGELRALACHVGHVPQCWLTEARFPEMDGFAPSSWLRIHLVDNMQIFPRVTSHTDRNVVENARTQAGATLTSYHGTRGEYALNALRLRLRRFTAAKYAPDGPPVTAVNYAWPSVWPGCTSHTMALFELQVAARTTHSQLVYATSFPDCYEAVALLLGRFEGPADRRRALGFIEMHNGIITG